MRKNKKGEKKMSNEITIALGQISCRVGDKKYNIEKMNRIIKQAKKRKAEANTT